MKTIKNNEYRFIKFIEMKEEVITKYPLSGSFAVVTFNDRLLLCYNTLRKQWELPAGHRELGETPKNCAIRELFEETGQKVNELQFLGLLVSENEKNYTIKYNPVYYSSIEKLSPFLVNDETTLITLWDGSSELGPIDKVDFDLIKVILLTKGD